MHNLPIWNCPKKIESREQSIIIPYREFFNHSLPKNKQYWTMSGSYSDHNNNQIEGEFHQLEKEGLISSSQFYAVDIDPIIIENNKRHYPHLNFYNGDFFSIMREHLIDNNFNPAIINCDNTRLIERGADYLIDIFQLIDRNIKDELLLVSNLMLNHPYEKSGISDGKQILSLLLDNYILYDHWSILPYYYKYHGSGKRSNTWMGTILFIKSKHKELKITKGRELFNNFSNKD